MSARIFISYRRSDQARAELLHRLLKERGVDSWYDALLGAGEDWRTKTAEALVKAQVFVLLFSKAASESGDIVKELSAATLQKKTVIPVRIEDIQPEGAFLYELASRNWFDAFEHTQERFAVLADQLAALVKTAPEVAPAGAVTSAQDGGDKEKSRRRTMVLAGAGIALAAAVAIVWAVMKPSGDGAGGRAGSDRVAFFGFAASGDDPALKDIAARATDEAFANLGGRRIDTVARGDAVVSAGESRLDRAAELAARFAVSGEVRRDGDNNVFAVRIENVASRATLWESSVTRPVAQPLPISFVAADRAVQITTCIVTTAYTGDTAPQDAEALAVVASGCGAVVKDGGLRFVPLYREMVEKKIGGPAVDGWLAAYLTFFVDTSPPAARADLLKEAEQALARADRNAPDSLTTAYARARLAIATFAPPAKWIPEVEAAMRRQPKAHEGYVYSRLSATATQAMWAVGRLQDALAYARVGRDADALSHYNSLAQYITLLATTGVTVGTDYVGWDVHALRIARERPDGFLWESALVQMIFSGRGDVQAMLDTPIPQAGPDIVKCYRELWPAMRLTAAAARRAAIKKAEPCMQGWDSRHVIVEAASIFGDLDMAFAQLDTPEKVNHNAFRYYPAWFQPRARALRADARFLPLMQKLGYVDYWKQTKTQPDACATPEERDIPLCVMLRAP